MICAVVLAAGRSVRMGTQKLLLPLGDKPVITRVADELFSSQVKQILIVVGSDGDRLREALGERAMQFIENPDPTSDMLASVRLGLRELPPACEAVLIALGDQPGISRKLVDALIHCYREDKSKIVVPVCGRRRGHPVLFGTRFCDEVLSCHDGTGLRGFLDAHPAEVHGLVVSNAATLEDMDTPADYRRQEEWFRARSGGNRFAIMTDKVQQPFSSAIP